MALGREREANSGRQTVWTDLTVVFSAPLDQEARTGLHQPNWIEEEGA